MLSFSGFLSYRGFGIGITVGTVAVPLPPASWWRASWVALRFDFFLGKLGARGRCMQGTEALTLRKLKHGQSLNGYE